MVAATRQSLKINKKSTSILLWEIFGINKMLIVIINTMPSDENTQ